MNISSRFCQACMMLALVTANDRLPTEPKAFLRCSNDARLDTGPMEEVIDHAAKNKLIANCVPDYDTNTAQGTEGHQVCTCPDDADVYRQYDTYTEVGMVVNDDNVEGTHELREKIILDGIKQSFGTMDSVMYIPGEFEHGVRYELEIPKDATRPASKQTWYRKIVVEPVDKCVDTTIPERFQQKCHKYARCVDTPLSYTCECREGFQCEDCDGFRHGFGPYPQGPGCKDETPPTIVLGGPWPAYSETCACGDDDGQVIAEMPSADFLAQNGLTYTGTDHDVDENFNVVVVPFDGVQRHAPKRVTCDDIPLTNPEGTKKNPVRCDEDSIVWKIEYTATDSSGNKATPQSHIVIQRKTQVLQRVLELETFVEKMEAEQSGLFESTIGIINRMIDTGGKAGLAFLLLLATAAFHYRQRLLELEAFVEKMKAEQSGKFKSMSGDISHIVKRIESMDARLQCETSSK
eukprot:g1650.t1